MATPVPTAPAIAQACVHTAAILTGVLALVALARTTISRNDDSSQRTAMAFLAACWVVISNGIDISQLAYALKSNLSPKHPAPSYRLALHVIAICLSIGGGILMLATARNTYGQWGGWNDWDAMAFVLLIAAAGFHYVLFVGVIVEAVLPRLRGGGQVVPPKSTRTSDESP